MLKSGGGLPAALCKDSQLPDVEQQKGEQELFQELTPGKPEGWIFSLSWLWTSLCVSGFLAIGAVRLRRVSVSVVSVVWLCEKRCRLDSCSRAVLQIVFFD